MSVYWYPTATCTSITCVLIKGFLLNGPPQDHFFKSVGNMENTTAFLAQRSLLKNKDISQRVSRDAIN